MTDGTEVVKFVGGVSVSGWGFIGFNGAGAVLVGSDGIEFRLNDPFGLVAHRFVKRSDLGTVSLFRHDDDHWQVLSPQLFPIYRIPGSGF